MDVIDKLLQFLKPKDAGEASLFRGLLRTLYDKPGASRAREEFSSLSPEELDALLGASRERPACHAGRPACVQRTGLPACNAQAGRHDKALAVQRKVASFNSRLDRIEKRAANVGPFFHLVAQRMRPNGAAQAGPAHPLGGMFGAPPPQSYGLGFTLLEAEREPLAERPLGSFEEIEAALPDVGQRLAALEAELTAAEALRAELTGRLPAPSAAGWLSWPG